jgi:AcrR family transcriptional regulator
MTRVTFEQEPMSEADVSQGPREIQGKRERSKQQNRQAILDAAREVFSELGYEAATVRDIIRRTGLAAGTFYNYYRSKEEVRAALAADGARRFAPVLKSLRGQTPDFASFVHAAMRAFFEFVAAEHAAWAAKRPAGEAHAHVRVASPEIQAVFAEVRSVIEAAIAARKASGADPDYLAAACIGLAREVADKMLERRPIDTEAAADFAAAMILGGVRGLLRGEE